MCSYNNTVCTHADISTTYETYFCAPYIPVVKPPLRKATITMYSCDVVSYGDRSRRLESAKSVGLFYLTLPNSLSANDYTIFIATAFFA